MSVMSFQTVAGPKRCLFGSVSIAVTYTQRPHLVSYIIACRADLERHESASRLSSVCGSPHLRSTICLSSTAMKSALFLISLCGTSRRHSGEADSLINGIKLSSCWPRMLRWPFLEKDRVVIPASVLTGSIVICFIS